MSWSNASFNYKFSSDSDQLRIVATDQDIIWHDFIGSRTMNWSTFCPVGTSKNREIQIADNGGKNRGVIKFETTRT